MLFQLRRIIAAASVAGVLVTAGGSAALAGDEAAKPEIPVLSDKFFVNLGGYLTEFRTDASLGSGQVLGAFLRLEDQLGLEPDQTVVRIDGAYRFNPKHAIGFSWWSLSRNGSAFIEGSLDIEDETFSAGALLESEFKTDLFRLDWRYSLLRADRGEAGFVVGLSTFNFDLGFQGQVEIQTPQGFTSRFGRVEQSVLAPVPNVGIFFRYAITPRLLLDTQASWLDAEIGDIEAKVKETIFTLTYYFTPSVGIGFGGHGIDISYRDTGTDPLFVEYNQSGFLAYLALAF